MLDARGIPYRRVSPRQLNYKVDGILWSARADYENWRVRVESSPMYPRDVLLATANVARAKSVHDGIVGHTSCMSCAGSVATYDRYCRHCGARLIHDHGGDS